MVAKVPRAKSGVKNKPHVKTMTKTIVKKNKNKAINGIKDKSLKSMKKKKLKDLKKKAAGEEKLVKILKEKPKSKKVKGTKKLKKKIMIKDTIKEESVSPSVLVHENEKEDMDTKEISPKAESGAVASDISTEGERSVVAEEMESELLITSDVSINDHSSELRTEEMGKDISPKDGKKNKKKEGKGKIKKAGDGLLKKKGKLVAEKKGKLTKKKAVVLKKTVGKDVRIKKKKLKKVAATSVTVDMESDHDNEDNEFCGMLSSCNGGGTDGLEKDEEQRCATFNRCLPVDEDDNIDEPSTDKEARETESSIPVEKCVIHHIKQSTDFKQKTSTKKSGKKFKREPAPMSFVLGMEQDFGRKEKKKMYTAMVKKRESELTTDLFGDLSGVTMGVGDEKGTTAGMLPKKSKRNLKKRKVDGKIPGDPFDIHDMEVSARGKKPAWVDDDDENIRVKDVVASMTKARGTRGFKENSDARYENDLREKFRNVIGNTPDWADLNNKPEADSDDHYFIKNTGDYLSRQSASLPKMSLEYKQMADLNSTHTEGAFIKAIDFNSHLQVGLVAGTLQNLGAASLFQVDGNANHKIQSVRFPSYPITSAQFLRDGKKFVVGSNIYNHFYVYDLETSKETKLSVNTKFEKGIKKNLYVCPDGNLLIYLGSKGKIFIYEATTLSLIDIMEAPHPLTSATITSDGSKMYTHGLTGEVCIWDLTARECVHKFYDEGCIASDAIAVSPNNRYLACGSRSGIVNVYDASNLSSKSYPGPTKVLSNLTTNITALTFNATSEVLVMASNVLPNAVKLVHFPSMTVFENFPRLGKVMKRSETVQFSPKSGYLAVGDTAGAVPLFRLKHYSSY